MTKAQDDADNHRIWLWTGISIVGGAVAWLAGWGLLHLFAAQWETPWHTLWALAGVSFLGAVILPFPGGTAALLVGIGSSLILGAAAVLGTAIGGTIGAALLFGLGGTGRRWLEKRATKNSWKRKVLDRSERLVKRWTYVAVGVLLVPFFIPRVAVLYPAVTLKLQGVPFLIAVFTGTLVRNAIYYALIRTGAHFLGA